MGYESRLYVVNEYTSKPNPEHPEYKDYSFYQPIMIINASCMPSWFNKIFTDKMHCEIYDDNDNVIDSDKYGDELKTASLQTVIDYLRANAEEFRGYRRYKIVLGSLEAIEPELWDDIKIIHYGY